MGLTHIATPLRASGRMTGTVDVLREFSDPRMKIIRSEKNVGPYEGLNVILDHARGELVAVQDHDDVWFPEKLSKQVSFLKNNREYAGCGALTFYYYEVRGVYILNPKPPVTNFVDHTSLIFFNTGVRYDPEQTLSDEHFEKQIRVLRIFVPFVQREAPS
jgi:glycosyltransferase involved in cell wall biosynthesis